MRRRAFATVAALACAFVVAAAAGATGRTASAYPDLSTRQAVNTYLRSLGVNPVGVVVQRGMRNYAGPYCPGQGWTCTKATRVLQIAKVGGNNTVDCPGGDQTGSDSTDQVCTITQSGPGSNTATCTERSTAPLMAQDCTITQTGTNNSAMVMQTIDTLGGSTTQNSTQTAEVTQNGDTNSSSISQQIHQKQNGGSGTQSQDNEQSATVCQGAIEGCTATNTGSNSSRISQSVFAELHATGSATQSQETGANNVCADFDLCANVTQSSIGSNSSNLSQQQHLLGVANTLPVTQTQGNGDNGVEHHFDQNPAGTNTANVQQQIDYDLHGPPSAVQSQDPRASCCSTGTDTANVHQSGKLSASEDGAFQDLELLGNVPGQCNLQQNAQVNNGHDTEHVQGNAGCLSEFACINGPEVATCPAPIPEAPTVSSLRTRFGPVATFAPAWRQSLLR